MNNDSSSSIWLLIAGLSGAGKTTALETFSDLGFYTIDNLPVQLFPEFIELTDKTPARFTRAALLLDIDSEEKQLRLLDILADCRKPGMRVEKLFLDCRNETILKRYSETRRPHPGFDPALDKTLADAIQRERERLQLFKERANQRFDSSQLTVHDLKRSLRAYADTLLTAPQGAIRLNFTSFGFKYGSPFDCDLLIDVRFLPNPYFVENLREQTGLDQAVASYVLESSEAAEFVERYADLLNFLLPHYAFEGKAYLNIGIGCTGGKHRSVAIAEELSRRTDFISSPKSVQHRDIDR